MQISSVILLPLLGWRHYSTLVNNETHALCASFIKKAAQKNTLQSIQITQHTSKIKINK